MVAWSSPARNRVNGELSRWVVQRIRCVQQHADGVSAADIAENLGVSVRWVHNWRERPYAQTADAPRSGRPRVITPPMRQFIGRVLRRTSVSTSSRSLARRIYERFGVVVSATTVYKTMRDLGYRCLRRPIVPPLTPKNIRERRGLAQIGHGGYGGHNELWWQHNLVALDESLFPLMEGQSHGRRFCWVRNRRDLPPIICPGQQVRYMMLLAMSGTGVEHLWLPQGVRLNTDGYLTAMTTLLRRIRARSVRRNNVLRSRFLRDPNNFTLLQDGATCHTSHRTQAFLQQQPGLNLITAAEWPGSSPDLNPVENIFSIIKRRMYTGNGFRTEAQMKAAARRVINGLSRDLLANLTGSMTRRLRLVRQDPTRPCGY